MIAKLTVDRLLATPGIDIVAGIQEDALNRFAASHHTLHPEIYAGAGEAVQLDLKYTYSIDDPLLFDLAPIEGKNLNYKRALLRDPQFHAQKALFKQNITAPEIKVALPSSTFVFTAISTNEILAKIRLKVVAQVAVLLNTTPPGSYSLFVTDIFVDIEQKKYFAKSKDGCDLEKLVEHLLQIVLQDRLNRFLSTFPLPQPQQLLTAFTTNLKELEIADNTLVVGLEASSFDAKRVSDQDGEFLNEHDVFDSASEIAVSRLNEGNAEGRVDFRKQSVTPPRSFKAVTAKAITDKAFPSGDLFVALSQKAFQLIADKKVNLDKRERKEEQHSWYYYWFEHYYRIFNPRVTLISSGLNVAFDLRGGAAGGAGLKGCSSWIKASIGADASAVPDPQANLKLYLNGKKELWLWPFSFPFYIIAKAWMKPWIPGLNFVLSIIVSALLSFFTALILPLLTLLLRFRLITLPDKLPGTTIPITPTFAGLGNWDSKLFVAIDVAFPKGAFRAKRKKKR